MPGTAGRALEENVVVKKPSEWMCDGNPRMGLPCIVGTHRNIYLPSAIYILIMLSATLLCDSPWDLKRTGWDATSGKQ